MTEITRNYANFIDAYVDYTSEHESTVRVRKWCAISIVAAALERKTWIDKGYYLLFPNLYIFIIGKSGLVKKSTSTGIAVNLIRELSDLKIMSDRLTASSLIEQLLLAGKKYEHNGRFYTQSAVFSYAPELAVFLEEVYGDIVALLTRFYDCDPHDCTKPWVHGTIGRGERKIYGPCLNILGASTKAWLRKCIPTSEVEGGFTSRIIFVVENRLPDKLIAWPEFNEERELSKLRLVEDLRQIHDLKGAFHVEPAARALFSKWYEYHMKEVLPQNSDPRMVGYMSRKGDTILKLAMTHSVSRGNSISINTDDLKWADKELSALEEDWKLAFDGVVLGGALSFEILQYVHAKGCIPKEELLRYFAQTSPMALVLKSVSSLKEMEDIADYTLEKDGTKVECYISPGYDLRIKT